MAPPLGQGRSGNAGLALLVVLLLVGVGFAVHFVWIIAAIFFVIWLVGFGLRTRGKCGQAGEPDTLAGVGAGQRRRHTSAGADGLAGLGTGRPVP